MFLIKDKKNRRLNSIVSSFQQWCSTKPDKTDVNSQRIFLIHTHFKIKTNQNYISVNCDNDVFTFDIISAIYTTSLVVKHGTR